MRSITARLSILGLAAALLSATGVVSQGGTPSPAAKADCAFSDGKTITMNYSSPRMRGRKIYPGLVPFGEVWRTGANEATTLETSGDLTIGGKIVGAGKYTIFTVPNATEWTLVIHKKTGIWGIPYPGPADDLLRTTMKVSKLSASVENFTISFSKAGGGCTMQLDWETTRASVEISQKK